MQLVYFRTSTLNFGDDLNAVLWPALAPELFNDDPDVGFVGIGTIIGRPVGKLKTLHVFSSGVGNDLPERWKDKTVRYWCVRGPVSTRVLGLPDELAITDGAILTPLIEGFPKKADPTGGTVVIPHFQTLDFPGWGEVARQTGFELLDPRAEPNEVINKIVRARMVLTESLHGAIIADLYGVPWLAFTTSRNFGVPKWIDWTRSLGRDFRLAMVPPPEAGPILAYGRTPAPFGQTVTYGAEDAMAQFAARLTPPPPKPTAALRQMIKRSPLVRPLLGFSPARTAEALERLSRSEAEVSAPALCEALQGRMMERLSAISKECRVLERQ